MNARGQKRERARFPGLEGDIGEDPARFLDQHLVEGGSRHVDTTGLRLVVSRIQGIDRVAVARAWLAVERNEETRGPRDKIVHLLERRIEYLEENGERPDPDELAAIAQSVRADHSWDAGPEGDESGEVRFHQECGAEVEPRDGHSWFCPDCETLTNRVDDPAESGDETQLTEVTS